jgi:hypothetical protein
VQASAQCHLVNQPLISLAGSLPVMYLTEGLFAAGPAVDREEYLPGVIILEEETLRSLPVKFIFPLHICGGSFRTGFLDGKLLLLEEHFHIFQTC